jgi:LPXTG-motif cell wall-anchored protein
VSEHSLLLSATPGSWTLRRITVSDNSTNSTSTQLSEATARDKPPDGQSGLSTGIKVGIAAAIVGIFVGLLGGLGIHLWRRKRSKRHTLDSPINTGQGETSYLQSTDVPNGEFMSMFFIITLRSNPINIYSISSHFCICGYCE